MNIILNEQMNIILNEQKDIILPTMSTFPPVATRNDILIRLETIKTYMCKFYYFYSI